MPQLSFPQQSVSVPTGVPQQQQTFQGFQQLGSGLLNLGQAQQHAQNQRAQRQAKQGAYQQYLETASTVQRGLSEINQTYATADERQEAGNAFFQKTIEDGLEQAVQGGYADQWLQHAVPFLITKQDKFLTDNDNGRVQETLMMLDVEGDHMVQQLVNEGIGFTLESDDGGPARAVFNDDTHELMGVHAHNYYDLVASHPELSREKQAELITKFNKRGAEQVLRKLALGDPEGFLNQDPTKGFVVPMPLFDVDGGFRSIDTKVDQSVLVDLRKEAYAELSNQHSNANWKSTQADKARTEYSDQVDNRVQQAIIGGESPDEIYARLDEAERFMDPGKVSELRRQTRDYFNARAGSPHEPLDRGVQSMIDRIQLAGVTGKDGVSRQEIVHTAAMEQWSQHERSLVDSAFAQQETKATTHANAMIGEQINLMKKRFTSIITGANPLKISLDVPADSIDRLAVEVQQAMRTAFEALPPEQRDYETILKLSYEAQVQAIGSVFSSDDEKLKPPHLQALGNVIQSQLPQGKPPGMTTRGWVLQNVLDGKITREESYPLLFMSQLYDINAPAGERQALDNQRAQPKLFEEHDRIKRAQESGNEILLNIEREIQDYRARVEAARKEQERIEKQTAERLKAAGK